MIEAIQPFLAPAVMFSAGGLLCLAQFARFTAIVGLVRSFGHERFAALLEAESAEGARRDELLQRALGLEEQAARVLGHANTVRNALRLLVGGILLMVLCSLTVGASLILPSLERIAVGVFVLGLLSTFVGLCLVLVELSVSLDVVRFEHENLARFRDGEELIPRALTDSGIGGGPPST